MNSYKLLNLILIFTSLYLIANVILGVFDKRALKMVSRLGKKRKTIRERIRYIILKHITVPIYYIEKFNPLLKKTKKGLDAKQFYVDQIIQICIWVVVFIFAMMVSLEIIAVAIILLSIADIFNRQIKVRDEAKEYEKKVLIELPQLIQYIVLSINTNQDLISILEKYRKISNEPLLGGIERLLTNLNTSNFSDALIKFEKYFEMDEIRALVSGLIKVEQGIDQRTYFYLLGKDVRAKVNKYKIKRINKKPAKFRINSTLVLVGFILMIAYPAIMYIYSQIKLFY